MSFTFRIMLAVMSGLCAGAVCLLHFETSTIISLLVMFTVYCGLISVAPNDPRLEKSSKNKGG
jgi:hypothetical protein